MRDELAAHITVFHEAVKAQDAARALVALRRVCLVARAELQQDIGALAAQLTSEMGQSLCQAMHGALHVFAERLCLDEQPDALDDMTAIARLYARVGWAHDTSAVTLLAAMTN